MSLFEPILLSTQWYKHDSYKLFFLADWSTHVMTQGETVELWRTFNLEPIGEVCLRFPLHIDAAPALERVPCESLNAPH